jgi:hypothetical protein
VADRTAAALLERPPPLSPGRRRRHALILGLIVAVGLARGAYWSAITPVFSPIDEVAHFGYVQSVAEGRIPVIGRDLVSSRILRAVKNAPTDAYRGEPFLPTNADANWGPVRQQYEASAAPTYYALMAGPYWVGHPFGLAAEVMAVRLATVVLALLAIPLTWALARRMFPRHPPVWLAAAGLLAITNAFALGTVTNDSLAMVLALASVLALWRALDDGPSRGWVLAAGALLGLSLITKATALTVTPVMAALVIMWWWYRRPGAARTLRMAGVYAGSAAVVIAPWLLWNLVEYHAVSGDAEVDRAFGHSPQALTLAHLVPDLRNVRLGLFSNQLLLGSHYNDFWLVLLVVTVVSGVVVAAIRHDRDDLLSIVVCGLALPLGFVVSELIVTVLQHRSFLPVGRHLLPVLPFLVIGVTGSLAVIVTRRWLPVVVGSVFTVVLALESRATSDFVRRAYEATAPDPSLAPVVDQSWSDHVVTPAAIRVKPPCPVAAFTIGFAGPPPARLRVRSADAAGTVRAIPVSTDRPLYAAPTDDAVWYRLPTPWSQPFTIELPPGTPVNASVTDRAPELATVPSVGDPVARLYCRESGARELAFRQTFDPNHADWLTASRIVALADAAAASAALATAAAAVVTVRKRRKPRPDRAPTSG